MARARVVGGSIAAVVCAAAAIAGGCRAPTQIRVEVTTDVPCADVNGTTITVGHLGEIETKPIASMSVSCEGNRVGAVVLVPSGEKNDAIAFKVATTVRGDPTACEKPPYGPECIVARRALNFIPNATLLVPVAMRASCQNVPCALDQTCVEGVCKDARIADPSACTSPDGCGEGTLGGVDGGAPDGAAPEGGADASDGGGADADGGSVGIELALGANNTCARMPDATVKCWGANEAGQLGNGGTGADVPKPTTVNGLTGVRSISIADALACAVMNNDTVQCWGNPALIGRSGDSTRPGDIGLTNVASVSTGRDFSCALTHDKKVYCWGAADGPTAVPSMVPFGAPVEQVSVGEDCAFFRMTDGHVRVFGADQYTQLGLGPIDGGIDIATPTEIPNFAGIDLFGTIGSGGNTPCARASNGDVSCWGRNGDSYQAGNPSGMDVPTPQIVSGLKSALAIASGIAGTCALRTDGRMVCMGNYHGTASIAPQVITELVNVDRVWAGSLHYCARTTDGTAYCFGPNDHGQLGDGTNQTRTVATPIVW